MEMITIPRPDPGIVLLVVCDENGAKGWCFLREETVTEGIPEIVDLLHYAQHQLWVQTTERTQP